VSTVGDIATVVAPGITALLGAWYGARLEGAAAEKAELRALFDEAADVLERANQRRAVAVSWFQREGFKTSQPAAESIDAFRAELEHGAQIRDRLSFRTRKGAAVSAHYVNAILALTRVLAALQVMASLPSDDPTGFRLIGAQQRAMSNGEQDFNREKADFIEGAQRYVRPGPLGRYKDWRRRRRKPSATAASEGAAD
jgi:hypothetical protein